VIATDYKRLTSLPAHGLSIVCRGGTESGVDSGRVLRFSFGPEPDPE